LLGIAILDPRSSIFDLQSSHATMYEPRTPAPVLLVVAAFSRHTAAIAWGRERLEAACGPVARASEPFLFNQTAYYEATMGRDLRKQFLAFAKLVAPDCLPSLKRRTIALERELAESAAYPEVRPLNLDPGVLHLGKFLLATTKDQAHRIYLQDGIFAEVTLRYQAGRFEPWPWTYADYRQACVQEFLLQARAYYREQLHHRVTSRIEDRGSRIEDRKITLSFDPRSSR
jgi:hypothetical protein